ncbi:lytic murein transglycosylase [Cryptosporangium sp. NPDC048952]|uniref:lytic murein transglycosylase n=1 Tax=Cryptosporangium sp. NPDC048952 TaxID=3363961 RepID=UPI00371096BE
MNQAAGSDPDPAPAEEPPQLSAEPWRQAAVAWTQHAEAWAAQTEAAQSEAAARAATPPEEPEPERKWVSPTEAGDMLPVRAQLAAAAPAEPVAPYVAQTEPEVDDLGEMPDDPPVSPWPDLSPDERSAHAHVWQPTARSRRPGRTLAPLAGAAAFVLCLATASVAVWSWTRPEPTPLSAPAPPLVSAPVTPSADAPALAPSGLPEEGAASAEVNPAPTGGRPEESTPRPADALADWADALRQLDIPPTALQAYGYAEAVLARAKPNCKLSWTLLAGIGAVESNHGRYGGAALQPDGTSSRPIIGVPLAGIGVERVTDTDQGLLDGDLTYDRAIGPMQFLPATWKSWAVDADDNGRADPYDIDDASLAAGYYLCAGNQNLASGSGWSSAVFSYNHVPAYVERVYEFADAYGRAS